jgi:putative ABC transport system permease protein
LFLHNLKLSLRKLKANKLYSLLNITGFAIGFAVVMIIMLFIYNEITVDHNFNQYNRICRLILNDENDSFIRFEAAQEMMERYPEVELAAPVQYLTGYSFSVASDGNFAPLQDIISTDNNFFRTIDVGGFIKVRVTGVVENFPENTSFFSEIYVNIEDEKLRIIQSGDNGVLWNPAYIFIKLSPTAKLSILGDKLSATENPLLSQNGSIKLQPLKNIYFDKGIKNNFNRAANTSMIYMFTAIAVLILLLSIANHVNFSVSMQFSRLRETGIRKSFGAGISQLTCFHMIDNLIGVLISFIVSVVIVIEVAPFAGTLFERDLNPLYLTRFPVNLLILAAILAVTILTSIVPLWLVRKFDIYRFMSGLISRPKGKFINNILAVFQATFSIILIICLIAIQKQLSFAKHLDIGFEKENLLRIKLPGNFDRGEIVKQEFGRLPFVKSATLSLGVPGMINSRTGSGEEDNQFWFNCIEADIDFIETFGLDIISGRNFRLSDADTVCIINQAAFKKYGWDNIENKKFKNYDGLRIIGIVNDFHVSSLHNEVEPAVLILKNRFKNTLTLRLRPGNTGQQIAQLKEGWEKIMPEHMFDFVFYDEFFDSLYQKEERQADAVSIFAALALLITLMGMIGLIFQTTISRSKEIGIRKINGASVPEVMILLNSDLIRRMIIAFVIAAPVSYYVMNKWLQNFAYKTELSWWIFVAAGVIALGITLLTVSWQSWRAATRNPVEALRYE